MDLPNGIVHMDNLFVVLFLFYVAPECQTYMYDTQFQTNKMYLKLMKALLFHKFRNICIKTILWTRNTNCFTIFLLRNFRRKSHSDCEYHIVPWPRK